MRALLGGLAAAAGLVALGCAPAPPPAWNVLIVTFDTTRADHLGAYGHRGARTPVVDGLAADGVLFEHTYATVPITLPSHTTIMTGKVPLTHGVRDNGLFTVGAEQETLAEILGARGYRTAAAIGAFPLTAQFGLDQGFELYDDHVSADFEDLYGDRVVPKAELFFDERKAARVNEAALPWLEENADAPFFLWLHYFDPHYPHDPPPPYDQLFAHEPYDGEIAYADESLGVMLDHLERLGVRDRTLVVFTADHGEGRGEHNESTHSMLVYNSTMRVPLIVAVPGGQPAGRRVDERVSTVDILPTVLDLLGIAPPGGIQGESLARHFAAAPVDAPARDRRRLYGETLSPRLTRQWGELRAVIYGDYKYIHGPRPELYDIGADPDELNDLIAAAPDVAADLERRLADYLATHAVPDLDASSALDEESLRKLQALGYLQASGEKVGPIEERLRSDGDPPQDHAHTTAAYSQAKAFLFQNKPVEAREFLIDLLRDAPSNVHYLELMVSVDVQLGQLDAALGRIEQLLEASAATGYPPREKLQMQMAGIHLQRGQLDAAYDAYREALAIAPDAAGFYRLAQMHQARGEVHEQKRFLTRALDEDPAFAPARIDLAVWHAVAGEMEQAEGLFAEALRTQPYFARAHYNFGAFLAQTSRLEMAAARFARAVTLQPDYHQAHQALVEVHLMMDRVDDARRHFRVLAQQAPDAPETQRARAALEAFDG